MLATLLLVQTEAVMESMSLGLNLVSKQKMVMAGTTAS
jgi:hypothetical protein